MTCSPDNFPTHLSDTIFQLSFSHILVFFFFHLIFPALHSIYPFLRIFLHFLRFFSCYHISRHSNSSCVLKNGITGRTFFLPDYAIFPVYLFQTEVPFSVFLASFTFPLTLFFINLQFFMDRTTCRSFFFLI